jgi:hypothetical protein
VSLLQKTFPSCPAPGSCLSMHTCGHTQSSRPSLHPQPCLPLKDISYQHARSPESTVTEPLVAGCDPRAPSPLSLNTSWPLPSAPGQSSTKLNSGSSEVTLLLRGPITLSFLWCPHRGLLSPVTLNPRPGVVPGPGQSEHSTPLAPG